MRTRWWVTALVFVVITVVAVVLGTTMGNLYANRRVGAERQARSTELQDYFRQNVKGIDVGKPFPNISLLSADLESTYEAAKILPNGGLILFLSSSCEACFDAIDQLAEAAKSSPHTKGRLALIVFRDGREAERYIKDKGYDLPLYLDLEAALVRDYGIMAFPSYFVLDASGNLSAMGAFEAGKDAMTDLVNSMP